MTGETLYLQMNRGLMLVTLCPKHIAALSTGLNPPNGGGQRYALIHVGNEKGFVIGAEYNFLCKRNTLDAHDEVCTQLYESWFLERLLPNLLANSVILMDNASYHSRKEEKISTTASKKQDILDWLGEKGISVEKGLLKRADRQRTIDFYLNSTLNNIGSTFAFTNVDSHTVLQYILGIRSRAVGSDGISISMLKLTLPITFPYISHIINGCIEEKVFSWHWKSSIVMPLPKSASSTPI